MDLDDLLIARSPDALTLLAMEDLDRLSLAELDGRIAALGAEIARTEAKREAAGAFRSAADELFRR